MAPTPKLFLIQTALPFLLLVSTGLGSPPCLEAQVVPNTGDLVRIQPETGRRWSGTYLGRSESHLMVAPHQDGLPDEWPIQEVAQLEVSTGTHRPIGQSVLRSSLVLGVGLGVLSSFAVDEGCEAWCYGPETRLEGFMGGFIIGGDPGIPGGIPDGPGPPAALGGGSHIP